jgi:hypothetical protein
MYFYFFELKILKICVKICHFKSQKKRCRHNEKLQRQRIEHELKKLKIKRWQVIVVGTNAQLKNSRRAQASNDEWQLAKLHMGNMYARCDRRLLWQFYLWQVEKLSTRPRLVSVTS